VIGFSKARKEEMMPKIAATSDKLTPLQRSFVDEVRRKTDNNLAAHYAYCRVLGKKLTNYGPLPLGTEEVVEEIARKCQVSLL
jgi:hypothetical protein